MTTLVRFTRSCTPYNAGEIAGFSGDALRRILATGACEVVPIEVESDVIIPPIEVKHPVSPDMDRPIPRAASGDPHPDDVEIPDDWRDLSGNKLRAIAAKLSPRPVTNKAQAIAVIEAELSRRGA